MALISFGASVAGPGHVRDGLPNQDAWGHAAAGGGRVVVAADGLGSKPHAAVGSAAACNAVAEAVRIWLRHQGASKDVLLGLIHLLWRARVEPLSPDTAATTCLFAFMRADGSGLIGQLGDGIVLVLCDGHVRPLRLRDGDDFTNRTRALGVTRQLTAWSIEALEPGERTVILCTDGVADDLLESKHLEFAEWMEREIAVLPAGARWHRLARELRHWPTPHHIDDKTIAVLRSQA